MASPNEIRKGRVIVYQGNPHLVLEMMHRTQGRQAGFVQTTLRNLQSGSTTTTKFRSTDSIDILHTTIKKLEFSYIDADGYHFMDIETYEDTVFGESMVADEKQYLVEGNSYDILFVDGQAVKLELPAAVETTVIEAPEGIRGDTASNVQKPVTIDTGVVVQVPLFIKEGDRIRIDTRTREYVERVNR